MSIVTYDSSIFTTNEGWTDHNTNGFTLLQSNQFKKYMERPTGSPAFNEVGTQRDGIQGVLNQVYQVDFRVNAPVLSETTGILGLRDDALFVVTGPMIYLFISFTSELDVRTFPANAPQPITDGQWYTCKLKVITDNVEVYLHGGPQGYSNELLGTGPHTDIQNSTISWNANIAKTASAGGAPIDLRNYYVTDTIDFNAPALPDGSEAYDFLTKEGYR